MYLGLPLSDAKLNLSAFTPLIARANKQLTGWQAMFLNPKGKQVLVNSVVDSAISYLMAAMLLPAETIESLDQKRRTFIWSGKDRTNGARCLVAWNQVCMPKEKGGLGVKDVAVQNQCLLLKLLHRLHHPANSAWAQWAREEVDLSILKGKNAVGPHWEALRSLLPLYQSITFVDVGDGRATDFWNDCWTGKVPLAACFPNLVSHAKVKEIQLLF